MRARWEFQQIEPQLCRGTFNAALWDHSDWVAEEKYDGDRRIVQFCGKLARFTGRRKGVKDGLFVEKTANIPHLSGYGKIDTVSLSPPEDLAGTVLDGEVVFTGQTEAGGKSKYVTSIMGSRPEVALAKQQERGFLKFVAFDCLAFKGKELRHLPWSLRRPHLEAAVREWGNPHVVISDYRVEDKRSLYNRIILRGGEGVVLKNRHAAYGDQQLWVKVKNEETEDVVIMGYVSAKEMSKKSNGDESITKYAAAGMIGAIQVGKYQSDGKLVEVATVSGMTDDVRRDMTRNGKYYLAQVIEIKHNGREPTGRFRHPRFVRFREDKTPKECRL